MKGISLKSEAIGLIVGIMLICGAPADIVGSTTNLFTRVTEGPQVNDGGWSFGVSWVDYDGDTYPDLFVCNDDFSRTTDVNYLHHNNGNGTYTRIGKGDIASGGSLKSTCADFGGESEPGWFMPPSVLNGSQFYVDCISLGINLKGRDTEKCSHT